MSDDQNETVGYKCPPKHTQFKKGYSGNPRGRPKKVIEEKHASDRQLHDEYLSLAVQDIKVTLNGKQKTMSAIEGIYQKQIHKALAGDTRAAVFCTDRYDKYMVAEGKAVAELFDVHEEVEARLKHYIKHAQTRPELEKAKATYEEFKNSYAVRSLFERINSPIKKFKA